ncbi:hypothetical protein GCM10009840_27860 [Pseudolysinimonas kribbensis]|jgi:hypothetical protein|uniref:Uncharacterized protein n=1 Tax=Pseudolysinimonas kribbensis TaxID=433641 RepID=A0ABQ6K8S3_9MICO|nr:hypothetical protein [Pseudolysinimonas kribbensis]GMA96397.1 hypothetical protein GCM10025881_32210 [Pseudolysinimonas kribbensis]
MITTADVIHADVVEALPGVWRVVKADIVVGYVIEAGDRFVSLYGTVYNTSVEIAQTRDRDTAVRILLAH